MNTKQIVAVIVAIVIVAACVAAYVFVTSDNSPEEPKEDTPVKSGVTGTFRYSVAAYDIINENTEVDGFSRYIVYTIENGDVTGMSAGSSSSGGPLLYDSWLDNVGGFFLTPTIGYNAEEGVPNALLNGAVLIEAQTGNTVTSPSGEVIPVKVYAKPISGVNVFYNVDEEGVVYRIIAADSAYQVVWTLTSIE